MSEVLEGEFSEVKPKPKYQLKLRLVTNEEGYIIKELCEQNGFNWLDIVDWEDIYPFWLAVESEEEIIAAVQVMFGKPISTATMLVLKPGLPRRLRVLAVKELILGIARSWHGTGASLGSCFIPFDNKEMKDFLKKHGYTQLTSGNTLGIYLREPK